MGGQKREAKAGARRAARQRRIPAAQAAAPPRPLAEVLAESRDLLERAVDVSDEQRRDLHGEVWRLLCNHRVAVGLLCSRHGLDCVFNPYMEARLLKGGTRMIPRVVTPACIERMVGGLLEKIGATVAAEEARVPDVRESPPAASSRRKRKAESRKVPIAGRDVPKHELVSLKDVLTAYNQQHPRDPREKSWIGIQLNEAGVRSTLTEGGAMAGYLRAEVTEVLGIELPAKTVRRVDRPWTQSIPGGMDRRPL